MNPTICLFCVIENWNFWASLYWVLAVSEFRAFVREREREKREKMKSELNKHFVVTWQIWSLLFSLHLCVSLGLFFSLIHYYYCWFIRPWQHCPNVGPTFFYSVEHKILPNNFPQCIKTERESNHSAICANTQRNCMDSECTGSVCMMNAFCMVLIFMDQQKEQCQILRVERWCLNAGTNQMKPFGHIQFFVIRNKRNVNS